MRFVFAARTFPTSTASRPAWSASRINSRLAAGCISDRPSPNPRSGRERLSTSSRRLRESPSARESERQNDAKTTCPPWSDLTVLIPARQYIASSPICSCCVATARAGMMCSR
jgi:hypothetical protein